MISVGLSFVVTFMTQVVVAAMQQGDMKFWYDFWKEQLKVVELTADTEMFQNYFYHIVPAKSRLQLNFGFTLVVAPKLWARIWSRCELTWTIYPYITLALGDNSFIPFIS